MSFQGKYEILSTLSEGEAKSYRAKKISSGRPVILHHLAANQATAAQPDLASLIFKFLRAASKEASRNFLDMGDEEGRVFIVTADVPECLNLRQWLQSGIGETAEAEKTTPPAGGTQEVGNIQLTYNLTTDALRQLGRRTVSESGSASAEKAPGAPPSPSESAKRTTEIVGRSALAPTKTGENTPPSVLSGLPQPHSRLQSPTPVLGFELPPESEIPSSLQDAPTEVRPSLRAQATNLEVAAAGAEASKPVPKAATRADATSADTEAGLDVTGVLADLVRAPQKPVPVSSVPEPAAAKAQTSENVPQRKPSVGFEMVFRSDKPRLHPTLSAPPDPSEATDGSFGPPTVREELTPTPTIPGAPLEGLPQKPGTIGDMPALGSYPPAGGSRRGSEPILDLPSPPSPGPAWKAPLELEKVTRSAPAPGEYTRMMENVKSLAGLLPPESPPSGGRGSASPTGPGAAPTTSYLQMPSSYPATSRDAHPSSRPSNYLSHDGDTLPPRAKRKVWVPLVILGSLFIMTVALLVFFALK